MSDRKSQLEFTSDGIRLYGPPEVMVRLYLEWAAHPELEQPTLLIADPGAYFEWTLAHEPA